MICVFLKVPPVKVNVIGSFKWPRSCKEMVVARSNIVNISRVSIIE